MRMNNRQARFVEEYLVDFNATQAAIRSGYSPKTAYSIGHENLRKPEIAEAINARKMSAEEVLTRLSDIARGDIKDLMNITSVGFDFDLVHKDENGEMVVNPKTKLIRKIKQKVTTILPRTEDGEEKEIVETELELYSALEALSLMGKHHKLFTDKTEISGADGEAIRVIYEDVNPTEGA